MTHPIIIITLLIINIVTTILGAPSLPLAVLPCQLKNGSHETAKLPGHLGLSEEYCTWERLKIHWFIDSYHSLHALIPFPDTEASAVIVDKVRTLLLHFCHKWLLTQGAYIGKTGNIEITANIGFTYVSRSYTSSRPLSSF